MLSLAEEVRRAGWGLLTEKLLAVKFAQKEGFSNREPYEVTNILLVFDSSDCGDRALDETVDCCAVAE